jgi:hypothetical protein
MRHIYLFALAMIALGTFTGCQSAQQRSDRAAQGQPAAYETGVGPRYDQGWDRR